jgi:hypothetical protein
MQGGVEAIRQPGMASTVDADDGNAWVEPLLTLAQQVLTLYGTDGQYLDFEQLQAEVQRDQAWLIWLEQQHPTLRLRTVRPLEWAVHPSRNLETLTGVGQDSAAVYARFIGDAHRFGSTRLFRGWTGMAPERAQSAESEAKGLPVRQAGPDLIKKDADLDAEIARRYDRQIAAISDDQMMRKGKHHTQAVCAGATHLLDRVLAVVRADKAYEMRDRDGTALSDQPARERIGERYRVPQEVRRRPNKRKRRTRVDQHAERQIERSARAATAHCVEDELVARMSADGGGVAERQPPRQSHTSRSLAAPRLGGVCATQLTEWNARSCLTEPPKQSPIAGAERTHPQEWLAEVCRAARPRPLRCGMPVVRTPSPGRAGAINKGARSASLCWPSVRSSWP